MRKWLLMLAAAFVAVSCAVSQQTKEERAARKEAHAQKVQEQVGKMSFRVDVNYMYPARGAAKSLSYGYEVKVQGDSLYSHLPYVGRAYNIPYGGGNGLDFSAPISKKSVTHTKKGSTKMELRASNEEDDYVYTLEIFDDGSTTIDVQAQEREHISFSGEVAVKE